MDECFIILLGSPAGTGLRIVVEVVEELGHSVSDVGNWVSEEGGVPDGHDRNEELNARG